MDQKYPSKIDWWLGLLLGIVIVTEACLGTFFLVKPPIAGPAGYLISAVCLAVAGFIAWILFSTYYVIGDQDLVARSGPFRMTVPLGGITEVHPTHNPLSSPACSLDRLRINFERDGRQKFLLISPKDKVGFLKDLIAAVPALRPDGDRLVARR